MSALPFLAAATVTATALPWQLHFASSLVKVWPDRPLPGEVTGGPPEIQAVRGECEALQIVLSGNTPSIDISVAAEPLRSEAGAITPRLYRVGFLKVTTPSNVEGFAGRWPDPLIPDIDAFDHERRGAFPFPLAAGRHQSVLYEVCVPPETSAGRYQGALQLISAVAGQEVTLRMRVRTAAIPLTSGLPVTFGLSGRSLEMGHFGEKRGNDARRDLVRKYAASLLAHRISAHTMTRLPPKISREATGRLRVDFDAWDEELRPFLDRDAKRRFSVIDLRLPDDLPKEDWRAYAELTAAHLRERQWRMPLFAYVMDEPRTEQREELLARLRALEGGGVARLVTMPPDAALAKRVDIWAANVNCFSHRERAGEFCAGETPRSRYPAKAQVWWYVSCSSHGCGHGPFGDRRDAYFQGWPSYVVDVAGTSARIMGWQSFVQRIDGELYFDTVHAYGRWELTRVPRVDPWDDQFEFGGNGDGTLFYPGRPERIGGTTHIPIASLRLVQIRDGLEEWELLRLLASRGADGSRRAQALARSVAAAPHAFEHRSTILEGVRRQLLDALEE